MLLVREGILFIFIYLVIMPEFSVFGTPASYSDGPRLESSALRLIILTEEP
jgi:hypothetical protein